MFYGKRIRELEDNQKILVDIISKQTLILKQVSPFMNFANEKMDEGMSRIKTLEEYAFTHLKYFNPKLKK